MGSMGSMGSVGSMCSMGSTGVWWYGYRIVVSLMDSRTEWVMDSWIVRRIDRYSGYDSEEKKNGFTRVRSGDPHHVKMM